VWTEKDLNEYLTDPDKFLPGTKKTLIGIAGAEQRTELIDFLKTLRD
jgi:cytochrome c